MKVKIIQTTMTTMDENRNIESTATTENFVIEPEKGKILKNIKNGKITRAYVCVTKKSKIADYIEIDDPSVLKEEPLGPFIGV